MQYTAVTNPRYLTQDHQLIGLTVTFDHIEEAVDFVASPTDSEEHGRILFAKALDGEFGEIAEFTPPPVTEVKPQMLAQLKATVSKVINDQAIALGFTSIDEAITYVDEPAVPLYQQQAVALRSWRSLVWAQYDKIVAEDRPFSLTDAIASLPQFKM